MTAEEKRIRKMINRLALATIRQCRSLHTCCFCNNSILNGDQYRDKGYGARAHETCFQAVAREYREKGQ